MPFLQSGLFKHIVITMSHELIDDTIILLGRYMAMDSVNIIRGGETRQESVLNGLSFLEKVNPDYVLIHDGARPWITAGLIRAVLDKTAENNACIPAIKAQDAMKIIKGNKLIDRHLEREITYCAQTPQGFRFEDILNAHRTAVSDGITFIDDSEIYSKYIGSVYIVEGDAENRKITYKYDLEKL